MPEKVRHHKSSRKPEAGYGNQMADGGKNRKVLLLNGSTADVGAVVGVLDFLRDLAENKSEHFRLLLKLVQNEVPDELPRIAAELKRAGVINRDGSVKGVFRDVLLSACRETPEGMILGSPFAPRNPEEATFVQAQVSASEGRLIRFGRKRGLGNPPTGEGDGPAL